MAVYAVKKLVTLAPQNTSKVAVFLMALQALIKK
jgi:hypothetical protein